MTLSTPNTAQSDVVFFDVHTSGFGYLHRARIVRPKQGKPYLSVGISLLNGRSDNVKYIHFDTNVVGEEAINLVKECMESINNKLNRVMARVKLGDLWLDEFIYRTGEKAGQPGLQWKARLLKIDALRINGELYQPPVDK